MRPFDDDYDDLDEFEIESFAPNRRPHRSKQHHKSAGHKRHKAAPSDYWEDDDLGLGDDFSDYSDLEFDDDSGMSSRY